MTTKHLQATLGYLERAAREGVSLLADGDRDPTPAEVLEAIKQGRAEGLEFWPCCNNVDRKGRCQGC